MPAETVSLPAPVRTLPERIPLLHFLQTELAPFPGRAIATFRVVVACSVVLVLCMTLRVPESHLAVWIVTRVAMEESSESLLTGIVFLIALTIGLVIPLVLLTFAMDQAWLRFCLMAAMAALGLFLRQTFVIGALGFVIGLIGVVMMTVPDFIPVPELVVRGSLWLWPVFALGIAAAVAANLLIAPTDPARLQRVAERCARARRALLSDGMLEHVGPAARPPLGAGGSAVFPVLVELEHVVDSMEQALGPEGISRESVGSEPKHLFVLDAFTNPSYVRYALKGALAVMICYTLQSAVDWPGIRTCLITCLIVGLGSEGATVQKGTLRIAGALVGAAMGF